MKRLAGFFVVGVLLMGSGCGPRTAVFSDAHAAALGDSVRAMMSRFEHYSAGAHWDSLASLYSRSSSFRFLESGAIQYVSRDAIRDALTDVPPGTHSTTTYRDLRVDPVAPGAAMVTGLFETTFADSAGPRFRFSGALSLLWKHETEGWRIRSGHSSAPVARGG